MPEAPLMPTMILRVDMEAPAPGFGWNSFEEDVDRSTTVGHRAAPRARCRGAPASSLG